MGPLQIIFMGTAELSCASLQKLAADKSFQILAVITQPDKPKGRELKLTPSPVKLLAEKLHLPVWQPLKARDEQFIAELRALKPDLMVVVAYGQILPQAILDIPPHGCLNVHTSLLPKYRGAAPIQWAIANGDAETGVTIMKMDAGLDTGPILSMRRTRILPTDDSKTLHDRLAQLGADLLTETIPSYVAGVIFRRNLSRWRARPMRPRSKKRMDGLIGTSQQHKSGTGCGHSHHGRVPMGFYRWERKVSC